MNVFVLCTGRCGSLTFSRACSHIGNFSSSHESRRALVGPARLAYPDRHIEVDNRLSWLLGRLDEAYGDRAYYVHLTRDADEVARSFVARWDRGIVKGYRRAILMMPEPDETDRLALVHDLIATVTANIRAFLRDKTHVMDFRLETAQVDFPRFWEWIGASGDRAAGLAEWAIRNNEGTAGAMTARSGRARR